MHAQHGTDQLPDGLHHLLRIDPRRALGELTAEVNAVSERLEIRAQCVVLRLGGTDDADRSWPGDLAIQDVNRWERAVRRLENLPTVKIAVAEGTCAGASLDLLLAADYRIADPGMRLLLPVNDGHFWPGMAVYRLVQQVGLAHARQLVLWGHELPVRHALDIGLIDVSATDLDDAAHAAVVLMGRATGREVAVRRQLLQEAAASSYEEALGVHLSACDRELRRMRHGTASPQAAPGGGQ